MIFSELEMKNFVMHKWRKKAVFEEVPFMSRVIDIVILKPKSITTVELKLKNWRKAITQAKQHLIAADYNYICMPALNKNAKSELAENGIGFILYPEMGVIIRPKRSKYITSSARQHLLESGIRSRSCIVEGI